MEVHRNEREKASALLEETVTLQRKLEDEVGLARMLQPLGLRVIRRDLGRAETPYKESLAHGQLRNPHLRELGECSRREVAVWLQGALLHHAGGLTELE